MLVYSKNGIHITQVQVRDFTISVDGYGELIQFRLPNDGRIIEDSKYFEGLVRLVSFRTGRTIQKSK